MALAKLGPEIISAEGKLAGNVYKKDASGQHIVGMSRTLSKPSTLNQKKQRAWYGGHKKHEYLDPGPLIPDEPPKDKFTARVYSLSSITTFRDPSLFQPSAAPEPEDPEKRQEAAAVALEIFKYEWYKYGITPAFVAELLYHYWYIAMFTWGLIYPEALAYAKTTTIQICTRLVLLGKISTAITITYWIVMITACLIYNIGEFFTGHWGVIPFHKWNMLLRTNDKLYWAGLQAHPTKKMYTITQGPELPTPVYISWFNPERDYSRAVFFEPSVLFQFLTSSMLIWYTWTFGNIHLVIAGDAHPVGPNEYRMLGDEFCNWYLNMPVGFAQTPGQSLGYLSQLHNMWYSTTPI